MLVEFALVLPLLMVLIFVIVSFGLALGSYVGASQLASEAARYSTVEGSRGEEILKKWEGESGFSQTERKAVICKPPKNSTENYPAEHPGEPVEAKLTYKQAWLPVVGGLLPPLEVKTTAQMRIEATRTTPEAC